jgi:hypothetical protein
MDCAVSDEGDRRFAGVGAETLASGVDAHYRSNPDARSRSAAAVLVEVAPLLARPAPAKPYPGRAESYPDKHGYFDGEYWRKASGDHRIGFLAGYIECWSASGKREAVFTQKAEWYAERITAWFGISPDGADVRLDRMNEKIADVLLAIARRSKR